MRRILPASVAALMLVGLAVAIPPAAALTPPAAGSSAGVVRTATAATISARIAAATRVTRSASRYSWTTAAYAKWFASRRLASTPGWGSSQMTCLGPLWTKESMWRYRARSSTGKYLGIPQTTATQIRSHGYTVTQFTSYPEVQVLVGLRYIKGRFGTPCKAWHFWQSHGWY